MIPSPTIATLPCFCNFLTTLSLPSGRTPAITSSTPACAPIALAVFSLSPVSMTTCIPIPFNWLMASRLSSLMVSATAMIPRSFPSASKNIGVFPSSASFSDRVFVSSDTTANCMMYFIFPPCTACPSTFALSPFPGIAAKSTASMIFILSSAALSFIAFANGCSLFASRLAASLKSSSSVFPFSGKMSVTTGAPLVMVPVLSRAIICVLPAISSELAVLNRIPCLAPIPFPTIMATGVASPNAHGQLITSTDIPLARAKPIVCPTSSHTIIVTTAIVITAGTNIPDTLSAIFAIGALVAAASLTIWIIWASVVSSPTLVALHLI